jgi:hypothetical protein
MKNIFLIVLVSVISHSTWAQKYYTKTGLTEFKASVKTFEPIEAKNNSTTAVLNVANGQVASLLFVKAFRFRVALMEEHFNENYMDSDRFPKATFKGQLVGFRLADIGTQAKKYTLKGTLTIRDKRKAISTTASVYRQKNQLIVTSSWQVQPSDFDIKIPNIVRKKIAKTIQINTHYALIKRN